MIHNHNYDIIVMGAGPAGSAAATYLAQAGHHVLLLEKDTFPRCHIGESLMPATYWQFKRLGILPELQQSEFVQKHSVQFITQHGKSSQPFYFSETNPHESAMTWQVEREKFDLLLFHNAQKHGVEAHQGALVEDVLIEENKVIGAKVRLQEATQAQEVLAPVVVDATGQSTLISKKLGLRRADPQLKKMAVFSWFRGGKRDSGRDEGATLITHTPGKRGWFWYIPLSQDTVSVGVVADKNELFAQPGQTLDQILADEISKCQPIHKRLRQAQQLRAAQACRDFSYRSQKIAGSGYVLIGDAYSFIDPVYSTGVFLALKSAELAADTISQAIKEQNFSEQSLGRFQETLLAGVEPLRQLVYTFYDHDFSFGGFLKEHPQYRQNLIDLLTGDVFKPGVAEIFTAIAQYKRDMATRTRA